MPAKRHHFVWSLIPALTVALAVTYFASARTGPGYTLAADTTAVGTARPAQEPPVVEPARHGRLRPGLKPALDALGNRFRTPGKERLTLGGTIQRAGESQAVPFVAVYQQPWRLRFEDGQGQGLRTITFDGQQAQKVGGTLSAEDEALVELLVYDAPDGFFDRQMDGAATRFLGPRFRADDGASEYYNGPLYDIYQVADRVKVSGDPRRLKLFHLNSDTQLIEIVRYSVVTNGITTAVEVQLGDWQETQGQMFPRRIVRLENNQPILTLTITSVSASPRVEDGIFTVSQTH